MNVLKNMRFAISITLLLAFGGLYACGGGAAQVRTETAPTKVAAPSEQPGEEEEDLSVREEVKERIITYHDSISKEAQDLFREGTSVALANPPDYAKAIEKFEASIEEDPAFLEAYTNLGKIHEKQRHTEKARTVYQRALDTNGEKPETLKFRAFIGKLYLVDARHQKLIGNVDQYKALLKKGKAILDNILAQDENNIAANNAVALYWMMQNDNDQAEQFVIKVLAREPKDTEALNTRGLINLERGELNVARWLFSEKVLKLDPNSIEAYTNLGVTFVRMGKLPQAVGAFKNALKLDPLNLPATMNMASVQLNWLDYESAATAYKAVLDTQKDNAEAMIGLGSALWGQSKYKEAIVLFEDALKLNPNNQDLLLRIAKIQESHLDAPDDAIATLRKYMELKQLGPESIVARRIQMLIELKQMNEEGDSPEDDPFGDGDGFGDEDGAEETPAEETPAEEAPTEEAPTEEAPTEEAPTEEAPTEEAPTEEAPVEEAPPTAEPESTGEGSVNTEDNEENG
jgi:Tfp pilus assembly protein PilF